jgi:pSer/pThr/pTyr-binding forkhead associated (FHA) protein
MWKLVIEDDEGKRTVVTLTRDEYSMGRREGNVIRLTERNISRDHARIYRRPGSADEPHFAVEDLTSYNGVFVNGRRITHAHDLVHGDLIQVGDYRVVLQDEALADAVDPADGDWKATVPIAPHGHSTALLDRPNRLVMLAGPTPGTEFPLDRERITIGRAEDATVSVNHNSVSRLHCEVHSLGDGRFEIVDKGSSNGVRINGSDLRRGIVEPGDVIELGDVRLKFVGAGQIFTPSEGQQLAILTAREADGATRGGSPYRALPIAVFVVVVSAGALGAWMYTRPPPMRASAPAVTTSAPEQAVLAEAEKLCLEGDCPAAQAKLDATLPAASRWRDTAQFRDIETRWAESLIERADAAVDVTAKRELYSRVAQTIGVDGAHRKVAADRLQQLDTNSGVVPTNTMALPSATASASASTSNRPRDRLDGGARAARGDAGRRSALAALEVAAAAPLEAAPATAAASTSAAGSGGVEDRERQLALQGTPDSKVALKQQLEPRVYSGKASDAEVRLLISTCKDLGDKICVQQARTALAQRKP